MSLKVNDYTVAEFERLPEFNERYELISGKLMEKPVPDAVHSEVSLRIFKAWLKFDPDEKLGQMRWEKSVFVRDDYSPVPDLSYWAASRIPPLIRNVASPYPDLAIEIQSEGQAMSELAQKASDYIGVGSRLVWVIHPNKKIAAVFRPGQAQPETIQPDGELDGEDVIPGFKIKLASLFDY